MDVCNDAQNIIVRKIPYSKDFAHYICMTNFQTFACNLSGLQHVHDFSSHFYKYSNKPCTADLIYQSIYCISINHGTLKLLLLGFRASILK
jgi:hypothetical protein